MTGFGQELPLGGITGSDSNMLEAVISLQQAGDRFPTGEDGHALG